MRGSTFGKRLVLSTFGESHGEAIGGVLEGIPAGLAIDLEFIQRDLDRRRPGQSKLVTQRKEPDQVNILSGVFDGLTTGAPIGFIIENVNQRSSDYDHNKSVFRPSHADFTYHKKYGIRDFRGGGRSSARETAVRVVAGAIAKLVLNKLGVSFATYVSQVGSIELHGAEFYTSEQIDHHPVRCPDPELAKKMEALILEVRKAGDTIGGCVRCVIHGVPVGLGEPVFGRLDADFASAMMSINAAKAVEVGAGFDSVSMRGSQHNDAFNPDGTTQTNYSGGIQGGISNGMPITLRVAFKPVATLIQTQDTINSAGEAVQLEGKGRHDPCVVPRAVPIVEAMAALVLLDNLLLSKTNRMDQL
jgi:chorismate synthase